MSNGAQARWKEWVADATSKVEQASTRLRSAAWMWTRRSFACGCSQTALRGAYGACSLSTSDEHTLCVEPIRLIDAWHVLGYIAAAARSIGVGNEIVGVPFELRVRECSCSHWMTRPDHGVEALEVGHELSEIVSALRVHPALVRALYSQWSVDLQAVAPTSV